MNLDFDMATGTRPKIHDLDSAVVSIKHLRELLTELNNIREDLTNVGMRVKLEEYKGCLIIESIRVESNCDLLK